MRLSTIKPFQVVSIEAEKLDMRWENIKRRRKMDNMEKMDSMDRMALIVRHCRTFSEKKLKEYDLSFGEQVIMMFLTSHENVNQDTISKTYLMDKSVIAKTLNRLEQKEIIVRKQNPENKRENLISLTQSAKEILEKMQMILEEWNSILYSGMSLEDTETYNRLTKKVEENIEQFLAKDK